jgi:putative redox protein
VGQRITATVPDPRHLRVEAQTADGWPVSLDGSPPQGADSAAGPREVLLVALAGCTAMDVISILTKKRQQAASYRIDVEGESATEHPQVFTSIVVEHRVTGDVDAEALRRSIELSATRYCPVSAMLSRATTIEHRYRLADGPSVLVAVTGPHGSQVTEVAPA